MSISKRLAERLAPWALPLVLLAVWQAAVEFGWLSSRILPAPSAVLEAGWALLRSGEIWQHLAISGWRAAIGFLIGGAIGLVLGFVTGLSKWGERFLDSSVQMIRNVPHLALIPLVILWFGIDESAKIFLVALGTLFPIYLNTYHGIRGIDPGLLEMARSYGLSGFALFRQVILPGALPSILVGVRFALGFMWLTLIVAETISARLRHRLPGDERPRVPADRRGGPGDPALCRPRQARRPRRPRPGTRLATLAPGLPGQGRWRMNAHNAALGGTPQRLKRGIPLALRGVARRFGEREVLKDIDLLVPAGQFVAIVGRSGCGKSTLLRLLAGLDQPSRGELLAGSAALAEAREDTRLMFQDSRLLPWKRVIDNVGLGLRGDWRAKALQALRAVGLAERANEWPAALSGGQKQRVALARALIHEPRLLLLDEPLGALDALTRIEMQQLIEGLWREHGFTVLLVTHDVSEAVAVADRVILIEDGEIGLDLPVELPRPRSRGSARLAALEAEVLNRVLAQPEAPPQPEPVSPLPTQLRWAL